MSNLLTIATEDGGTVLLFEEADVLSGKRSEVKHSHDRDADIEVGYLHLPFPDVPRRAETWRRVFPAQMTLADGETAGWV